MTRKIGWILFLLLVPAVAAAQDPKTPAVNKVPAVKPTGRLPVLKPLELPRTDDLRIVSITPSAGEIQGASSGATLTAENSIEVVLEYDQVSSSDAVVSAALEAPGAGRITSFEASPNRVYEQHGRVRKRLAISCGPDVTDRVRDLRIHYWMFVPAGSMLVDKEQSLSLTVLCEGAAKMATPGPAARPGERHPQPSFEDRPVTARADEMKIPDRPVSPPATARADDVVRRPVPSIDPGVAKLPSPAGLDPDVAERIGACADPATIDLAARLVGRTEPSRGVGIIEIVGVVRNVGRVAYVSDPRQQSVELIEEQPGVSPRAVEDRTFTNLAPNATVRLVHRRSWDTSTEFQPRYRLRIVYEPDIRSDANPRNDDCGLANNEAVLEPERINALFR